MILPAIALGLGSCKKKEADSAVSAPVGIDEGAAGEAAQAAVTEVPKLTATERAAVLGFPKFLPQDTEFVLSLHNGSSLAKRVQRSQLWRLVTNQPEAAPELVEEAAGAGSPSSLFGEEFTIAVGPTGGVQAGQLLRLYQRLNHFQVRGMVTAFAESLAADDEDASKRMRGRFQTIFQDLLTDPESGIGLFEKMGMPPVYLAFKTSEENRAAAAQQVAGNLQMLNMFGGGQMIQIVEATRGDAVFNGYRIPGAKISEMLGANRQAMEKELSAETTERLLKAVAAKDLVLMSGVVGEYVVMFLGSSADDLVIIDQPGDSLLATDAMAFCDAHADKELVFVGHGADKALQDLKHVFGPGLKDVASGIRDGLAACDQFGDTRSLQALLRMVEDRESTLQALASVAGGGTVAYLEDGLKVESLGGYDSGFADWEGSNRMASLDGAEGAFLFANYTLDPVYMTKARAYVEALLETAYAGAMQCAELPLEDASFAQFKTMALLFDSKARRDLLAFWDAFSGDFNSALGTERAWVIDFKGSVPPVGMPEALVKEGKFPRLAMLAPVVDRAKLQTSWQAMSGSLRNLSTTAGELAGMPIPMESPLSSEKDGFTSWFFGMPFFNDEFVPSVTLDDEWFAASTSRNHAVDLLTRVAAGGEPTNGLHLRIDFNVLRAYARELADLADKHPEALKQLGQVGPYAEAMEGLDGLTMDIRRTGGTLRSSIHLKTR